MAAVAVMGGGSFGTAIACVMADSGQSVALWTIEPEVVEEINASHTNEKYHPGAKLPAAVRATSDELEALNGADIVVLAIPAQLVGENLRRWQNQWAGSPLVVSVMKGIELGSMRRMSEVIEQDGGIARERIAVISGPNLAKEIVRRQPAATTVASADEAAAKQLQDAVTTDYFRPYFTTDVVGCEIGGAVKNVIALANGMAVGLGFGDNTQASLITRGLAEMSRLGAALGANPMTFLGLAGMGDLVATCTSPLSRNRTFGENLGKGLTVQETIAITNQTAEGVKSCQPILQLAQSVDVEMPITEQVVKVVTAGDVAPRDARRPDDAADQGRTGHGGLDPGAAARRPAVPSAAGPAERPLIVRSNTSASPATGPAPPARRPDADARRIKRTGSRRRIDGLPGAGRANRVTAPVIRPTWCGCGRPLVLAATSAGPVLPGACAGAADREAPVPNGIPFERGALCVRTGCAWAMTPLANGTAIVRNRRTSEGDRDFNPSGG